MIEHRPIVVIDIETSGGLSSSSRIIEIGAIRIERGLVVDTFRTLVYPDTSIPSYITKLTGITNEMVWGAPGFSMIAKQLELFLEGAIFAAHNVNFDYSYIKREFELINIVFERDRFCTAKLSKKLYPQYRSHSLDRLIERMGINVENRHRAFDDAQVLERFIVTEMNKQPELLFEKINTITTHIKKVKTISLQLEINV